MEAQGSLTGRGRDARPRLRLNDDHPQQRGLYARPEGREAAEWHAQRKDHSADGEQMQSICAAATALLDAPRDPLFEIVLPPTALASLEI